MNISTRYKYLIGLLAFVLITSSGSLFYGCKSEKKRTGDVVDSTVNDDELTSKQLVTRYCAKCHALPTPELLTKDVWTFHTLPDMAPKMGISTYGSAFFKQENAKGISLLNWQKIVDYYTKSAPVALPPQKRSDSLLNDWAGFTLKVPINNGGLPMAHTTTVAIDSATHQILSSDGVTMQLFKWDARLNPTILAKTPSPVVNMLFSKKATDPNILLTCIGELEPLDFPNGRITNAGINLPNTLKDVETDIKRPLHALSTDMNKDGLTDYVVCTAGKANGSLLLLTQNKDKSFKHVMLKEHAGAVQSVIGDFNNDGWPDVMALFGAIDEGLSIFTNNKDGSFKERVLLRFPPVYGSTSFQLTDINHDGKPDLIYSCGYNLRDSRILKPYTGLYIYLNTGNYNFKQSYFYPINGCTKAIAADFDGDGDIDIATSAFFADLKHQPGESFVYFEQDKAMHFKPHAVPVSKYGRWFSMDVGDYNGDGKPDIVLGNYSKGLSIQENVYAGSYETTPLIVLENHTKK